MAKRETKESIRQAWMERDHDAQKRILELETELIRAHREIDHLTVDGARFDEQADIIHKQRDKIEELFESQARSNQTLIEIGKTIYTLMAGMQKIAERMTELLSRRRDESSIPR